MGERRSLFSKDVVLITSVDTPR